MSEKFCEAFMLIGELAYKRGLRSIKDLPGLTGIRIDAHWLVQINPHPEPHGGIPPCHMALEFNGWPAGLFSAEGGAIAAGALANEDELLAAVRAALAAIPEKVNSDFLAKDERRKPDGSQVERKEKKVSSRRNP